jgi:hypothetical protein
LFLVVLSGVVMSYTWATNLVYRLAGTEVPDEDEVRAKPLRSLAAIDPLLTLAEGQTTDWKTIALKLPVLSEGQITFTIDRGNGAQPQLRSTLLINPNEGTVVKWEQFDDQSRGRRARSWFRYVHTGEFYGVAGQTIVGLASLATVMLIWTGFSLWLKRLLSWSKVRAPGVTPTWDLKTFVKCA